jgi:TM2 domain-containing membrane protein YozV
VTAQTTTSPENEAATTLPTTADAKTAPPAPASLDPKKRIQYDANRKPTMTAYLLRLFRGYFGVHRFCLGKIGTACAILLTSAAGIVLSVIFVGVFILISPAVWLLIDLFLIPSMVRDRNNMLIYMVA